MTSPEIQDPASLRALNSLQEVLLKDKHSHSQPKSQKKHHQQVKVSLQITQMRLQEM